MLSLSYAYILLLLFFLLLCYGIASKTLSYAPAKIKSVTTIMIILMTSKCSSLIVMSLKDSMQYIYCLKYLVFLDIIYIPVLAFLSIYIFYRNEKVKFNYVYIPMVISVIFYYVIVVKTTGVIALSDIAGYIIEIESYWYINMFYLILNTFIMVMAVKIFLCNYTIKSGSIFLIFSAAITLILCIIIRMNMDFQSIFILSDIMWCICYIYALQKLKR